MTMLERVRDYSTMGLHPIPCEPRGKKPLVQWQQFQDTAPTVSQLKGWWQNWPDANIALVVGRGVVVVDLDGPQAQELLHEAGIVMPGGAPRVRTGNGQHVYLRLPQGRTARNRAGFLSTVANGVKSQVDLRADGGYVLAPPSIHPNGSAYEWLVPMKPLAEIPLVPDSLLALKVQPPPQQQGETMAGPGWIAQALRGVAEGSRDSTAARLAGYFFGKGHPEDVVVAMLEQFAAKCSPPLTTKDVLRIVGSIGRADARNPREAQNEPPRSVCVEHISVSVAKALDEMQSPKRGISTPFRQLADFITGGFQPGELIYVGARPGIGKTAFALELARHAAKEGRNVLAVSREMLSPSLARRAMAQEGKLSATDLKLNKIDAEYACRVGESVSALPVWITDSARSMVEIREALNSVPGGVQMLIVDYLQLLHAPREIRERRLQVEFVSHELKQLALERQIPVVCLSSLSRPPSGTNPEPTLASLRDSGELEHDADIVLFLHRELKDDPKTLCIVAKNRDGAVGVARLLFKPEHVSFQDAGYYED